MSETTKPKFPDTANQELRGLYINRESLEAAIFKREANLKTLKEDVRASHASTAASERIRLTGINSRIASLEKLEKADTK